MSDIKTCQCGCGRVFHKEPGNTQWYKRKYYNDECRIKVQNREANERRRSLKPHTRTQTTSYNKLAPDFKHPKAWDYWLSKLAPTLQKHRKIFRELIRQG